MGCASFLSWYYFIYIFIINILYWYITYHYIHILTYLNAIFIVIYLFIGIFASLFCPFGSTCISTFQTKYNFRETKQTPPPNIHLLIKAHAKCQHIHFFSHIYTHTHTYIHLIQTTAATARIQVNNNNRKKPEENEEERQNQLNGFLFPIFLCVWKTAEKNMK